MVGGWKVVQEFHEHYMNIISGTDYGDDSCGAPSCGRVCHPRMNCVSTGIVCVRAPCCPSHRCVSRKGGASSGRSGALNKISW